MSAARNQKPKLACPFCQHEVSKVVRGFAHSNRRMFRRRRKCLACQRQFPTTETVDRPTQKNREI